MAEKKVSILQIIAWILGFSALVVIAIGIIKIFVS